MHVVQGSSEGPKEGAIATFLCRYKDFWGHDLVLNESAGLDILLAISVRAGEV